MLGGLQTRLDVQRLDENRFLGRAAQVPARVYGGEVAAQAVVAANRTVDEERAAHVVQCTYLLPGDPSAPIEYVVERTRDGRSYSTRRVVAAQGDEAIFVATIGYTLTRPRGGFAHQVEMPPVPGPDELPTISEASDTDAKAWVHWASMHPEYEMRPVPGRDGEQPGRRQVWSRFMLDEADDPRAQSALAVYGSDFTMLSSVRLPHEQAKDWLYSMTTLNHTVYLHEPFVATEWHLVDHYSPAAIGGRGIAVAHTYRSDGALVASAVQEGFGYIPVPERGAPSQLSVEDHPHPSLRLTRVSGS